MTHPPPAWPASISPLQQRAAELGHGALHACMLLMPLSGYVASNFSKYGVHFSAWRSPWEPELSTAYAIVNGIHVGTAYVFAALIVGHVVMTWRHASADGHAAAGPPGRRRDRGR